MLKTKKIAVIGYGVMGEAILSGLIKKGGIDPKNITASGPREDRRQELTNRYGIQVVKENLQAVTGCEVIILAVKPQKIQSVIKGLKGKIPAGAVVISIVAGVSLELLNKMLGHDAVVRAMPNTPARIGEGITVWTGTRTSNRTSLSLPASPCNALESNSLWKKNLISIWLPRYPVPVRPMSSCLWKH